MKPQSALKNFSLSPGDQTLPETQKTPSGEKAVTLIVRKIEGGEGRFGLDLSEKGSETSWNLSWTLKVTMLQKESGSGRTLG